MELVPSMERTLTLSDERQTEQLLRKVSFRVSEPAGPYMQNILDKFPRAEITLVERLGRANWQRHMSVRRRMEDISRLAQAIQHYDPVNPEAGDSILRRHPELHDSGLGTTALPQSTDAASATSNTSIGSSSADRRGESRINVSIPYEGAARKPFQCKICGKMLEKVTRSKAWVYVYLYCNKNFEADIFRLHVLADIRPYVCTFSTCKDELVTFPTRKLWANHEFSEHRVEKVWHCMKCADVFVEVNLWRKHLGSRHGIFFSAVKFQSAAALAVKKMPGLLEHTQCPLCLDSVEPTRRAFATHVGKHLETIALTALPPEINYDTESEAGGSEIAIYSAGTEDHAEGITQQSKVAPEPGTINVVGSDQRGAVGSDTEHLTHYSHPEPSEPKCHFSLLHSTDMAGLQPQHEQDLSMLLPPCSKYQDYPQEDDRGKLPQHMSLRSRRIALACQRCRKRKVNRPRYVPLRLVLKTDNAKAKCSGFEDSKDGRCTGCRRAQEECTFNAVPSKAQTMVPRHTAYPHVRNTEIATEGYPFNVEIPGNDIFCSVFVWDTRSFSSHYTLLPESIIPKSSADMFLWVERYSRPPDFQVLEIEVGCRAVRQTFLVKRNNTQEYEQFLRLSKTLLENLLGGSTNVRIFVVVFVKPVGATYEGKESDAQKDLESLPSLPPRLAPESETPQTADELATPETEA